MDTQVALCSQEAKIWCWLSLCMMVKFRKHSSTIKKNPEKYFIISKSISSHLLTGKWFPRDFGMEEKESDGFESFIYSVFDLLIILFLHLSFINMHF